MTREQIEQKIESLSDSLNTSLVDDLIQHIELYGKTVARNVRHRATEILAEGRSQSAIYGDINQAQRRIMNIRFQDVEPKDSE